MQLLFLYFLLNKYYFKTFFNIFRIICGFFISLYYVLEYIYIFHFNIDNFYYIILYKYLIKDKLDWKKRNRDTILIKNKKKIKKTSQHLKKKRFQYIINKFWYFYYRKWMYWGWTLYFIDWVKWQWRYYKAEVSYRYIYKNKVRFKFFKKRMLKRFFIFFIFSNYNVVRFYFKLKRGIIDIIFFLIFLKIFIQIFLKIKIIYIYRSLINFIQTPKKIKKK